MPCGGPGSWAGECRRCLSDHRILDPEHRLGAMPRPSPASATATLGWVKRRWRCFAPQLQGAVIALTLGPVAGSSTGDRDLRNPGVKQPKLIALRELPKPPHPERAEAVERHGRLAMTTSHAPRDWPLYARGSRSLHGLSTAATTEDPQCQGNPGKSGA